MNPPSKILWNTISTEPKNRSLQDPSLLQAHVPFLSHNEGVEDADAENAPRLGQLAGDLEVLGAGLGVTGGVIVDEDHRGGAVGDGVGVPLGISVSKGVGDGVPEGISVGTGVGEGGVGLVAVGVLVAPVGVTVGMV